METPNNKITAEIFLDQFDMSLEGGDSEHNPIDTRSLVKDEETFRSCLAPLKERSALFKANAKQCDEKIKTWQEAKRHWQECEAKLNGLVADILTGLHLPSLKEGDAKASVRTSKTLVVDEELLVGAYIQKIRELQALLPPYIKVKVSVDKTALGSHVKSDPTLLIDHPEMAHWAESISASIK